jgi:hypothetical protein
MAYALRGSAVITEVNDDSTPTYTLPTHDTGDLLIVVVARGARSGTGITGVASGWADLYSPAVAGFDYIGVYGKIATSSSETNPTFTLSAGGESSACAMACPSRRQAAGTCRR